MASFFKKPTAPSGPDPAGRPRAGGATDAAVCQVCESTGTDLILDGGAGQKEAEAGTQAVTATSVASGFQDRSLADAPDATVLAFLPDDRLLVTGREGRVRVHKPGFTNTTVALDISNDVCSAAESPSMEEYLSPKAVWRASQTLLSSRPLRSST